jgi:hypothetical protein
MRVGDNYYHLIYSSTKGVAVQVLQYNLITAIVFLNLSLIVDCSVLFILCPKPFTSVRNTVLEKSTRVGADYQYVTINQSWI